MPVSKTRKKRVPAPVVERSKPRSRPALGFLREAKSAFSKLAAHSHFEEIRRFWTPVIVLSGGYLLLWVVNFSSVYGWLTDDHLVFLKAIATNGDWRQAFLFYFNALQPYFFLISWLPLKLGWSLDSLPLPVFGAETGQFRFLLLYSTILHTLLLIVWAWFARRLFGKRRVVLLGLIFWLCSPTLYFYGPQPDSRLIGLAPALIGISLLISIRTFHSTGMRRLALCAAGLLFGISQSLHYTALYLIVPVCLAFFATPLIRRRKDWAYWVDTTFFLASCLAIPLAIELISYFAVHIPWSQGPFMAMESLRNLHVSYWGMGRNLLEWAEFMLSQMGLPMILLAGWGWWIVMRREIADNPRLIDEKPRALVAVSIPLGIILLMASRSMPFFRQLSVLEPFVYLFAAVAVFEVVVELPFLLRQPLLKIALVAMITVAVPAVNSVSVFRGHLGLGKALAWLDANEQGRTLHTLPIFWYPDPTSFQQVNELLLADPNSLLLTYFPYNFLQSNPSFRACLQDTPPIASWPTLWGTEYARTQTEAFYVDQQFNKEPELSEARVYLVGDIQKQLAGETLKVNAVQADSSFSPDHQPANAFDGDAGHDGVSAWASAATPGPHFLQFDLGRAVPISEIRVISPPVILPIRKQQYFGRIEDLEVQGDSGDGHWHTLWRRSRLDANPVIKPSWPQETLLRLKCIVHKQIKFSGSAQQAAIEEIRIPGFSLTAPQSALSESAISAVSAQIHNSEVTVDGENFTPHTVINIQGLALTTRFINSTRVRGRLLKTLPFLPTDSQVYLTDGLRRSKELPIPSPLTIKAVNTDSDFGGGYDKTKLFDGGESQDNITSWASGESPMPHFVELTFAGSPRIGNILIVNRPIMRIDELDIQVRSGRTWTTVYQGRNLRGQSTIDAKWFAAPTDALKIIVRKNYFGKAERQVADIEELMIPGFWPVLPWNKL